MVEVLISVNGVYENLSEKNYFYIVRVKKEKEEGKPTEKFRKKS